MKPIIIMLLCTILQSDTGLLFDFGKHNSQLNWSIINDTVMGGKSQASVLVNDNSVFVQGTLSLENNGGFSSYRSPIGNYDLSKYSYMDIRLNTHGRTFGIMLETSRIFYKPHYKTNINTGSDWNTITIPLNDFLEYRLGNPTGSKISVKELQNIIRIGCILLDKQEGPFQLEIDAISFH